MSRAIPALLVSLSLIAGCTQRNQGENDRSSGGSSRRGGGEPREAMAVTVTVPAGTQFTIALDQAVSSKTSRPGDPVRAHVVDAIRAEGETVVAAGASVQGAVAQVEGAGRITGRAVLAFNFTSLETAAGMRSVQTAMVEGSLKAPGTKARDAATIIGGAAAGAVLGEILGDAKLGAIIGAAAGTGVVLATKGKEITLDPGDQLDLMLVQPLTVNVRRGSGVS